MSASSRSSELTKEEKIIKLKNKSIILDDMISNYCDVVSQRQRNLLKNDYDKRFRDRQDIQNGFSERLQRDKTIPDKSFCGAIDDILTKDEIWEGYKSIQSYYREYLVLLDAKLDVSAELLELGHFSGRYDDVIAYKKLRSLEKEIAAIDKEFESQNYFIAKEGYNKVENYLEAIRYRYANITDRIVDVFNDETRLTRLPHDSTTPTISHSHYIDAKRIPDVYIPLKIKQENLRNEYQELKNAQREIIAHRHIQNYDNRDVQKVLDSNNFPPKMNEIEFLLTVYKNHLKKSFKFDSSSELYKSKLAIIDKLQNALTNDDFNYSPRLQTTEFMEILELSAAELSKHRYAGANAKSSYVFQAYSLFRSLVEPKTTEAEKLLDKIGEILKELQLQANNPYKLPDEKKSKFCFK